jgi:hypothetical protein
MNLTWEDVLSDVIAGIIVAVLGILAGCVSGYAFSLAEKKFSYTNRQTKGITRFIFSMLLAIGVILSPSKLDDARGLSKMVASVPAVITANVIVSRSAQNRDRQKDDLRKRIEMAQIPSSTDTRQATSFKHLPPTQPPFTSRKPISTTQYMSPLLFQKRRHRNSSTSGQSFPEISSLFQGKRDPRKPRLKKEWVWDKGFVEKLIARLQGGQQNRWK